MYEKSEAGVKVKSREREGIELSRARRIVIKIGTSSLTDKKYRLDPQKVEKLTKEIVELRRHGKEVILVSSGAIGAGIDRLGLKQRPRDIKVLQATAAIGQSILMSTYDKYFTTYEQSIAQVLLTHGDFFDRQRYLNLRNTLITLLNSGVVPIINENDAVAVDEIKLGDNDTLSALIASNLGADLLIILTDTDGLFTYDPKKSRKAELIPVVDKITTEIERSVGKGGEVSVGVGSMMTKLQAARVVMQAGIPMLITNSGIEKVLIRIIEGEPLGTLFIPKEKLYSREHWILFASLPKGRIKVDDGAKTALTQNGSSLLPSGIIGVEEEFKSGDTVNIVDVNGVEFAKGITNYPSRDIEKIKRRQSKEIEHILGRKEYDEVVYRGNLVLLKGL